ncbi:alpha/beta fold hydrolase [Elizabethkingia argentiflava]|uniref:Alpha/beta fold hydrolase n=1 Tax=Elizabethkingia argenteiflava TaxID=2681556 RepID=A0A845PYC2_9FLAO|nr:alpha/beta hydrolase [Elizabethkingia argenteiflava]NAW52283.1 alpha/beta fold hydrolase [Elizabethkingia argenteiflava]
MIFKRKKEKKFTYIESGKGQPMVLLHGLMGNLSNFEEMKTYFSKLDFNIFIPQLPIYDFPVLNTNLTSISKYVITFIEEHIASPVTLVGNSMGGHVGLITALARPDLIKNLVLTGSSGLYERSFGDSFPRKSDKSYIKRKTQEVFYNPDIATDELVDEVFAVVNDRMKGIKTVILARSAMKHNMQSELPNITCPTCIIWGKQDSVTPPEVAEEMHKKIPNSDLFWIDQCGHAAMMEKPKEFNDILYHWIKDKI